MQHKQRRGNESFKVHILIALLILAGSFVSWQQASARITPLAVETIEAERLIALGDVNGSQDIPNRILKHQIFTMRPDGTNQVKLTYDSGSRFFQN
ncbi:hypothetical protein BH20ACI3_BH20ACI3_41740 [soil metagenome]